jgi:hypothetical protein
LATNRDVFRFVADANSSADSLSGVDEQLEGALAIQGCRDFVKRRSSKLALVNACDGHQECARTGAPKLEASAAGGEADDPCG